MQVAQPKLQGSQVFPVELAKKPFGQVSRQLEPYKYKLAPIVENPQVRQYEEVLLHVRQLALQSIQVYEVELEYWPSGQILVHVFVP